MTDARAARPAPPAHAGFDAAMRIDWIDPADLADGAPGRLGLTFMPGKRGPSTRYPPHVYRRETAADLEAMRTSGVVRLVLLVADEELERWGDPRIVDIGARVGLEVVRHPIPDGTAPPSETMDRILADVAEGRRRGDVAVACMGGVGRSGMVAACALVGTGISASDALRVVRRVRHPSAVETSEQEALVARFAERQSSRSN